MLFVTQKSMKRILNIMKFSDLFPQKKKPISMDNLLTRDPKTKLTKKELEQLRKLAAVSNFNLKEASGTIHLGSRAKSQEEMGVRHRRKSKK